MKVAGMQCAKERFLEFLSRKHLRLTSQRRAIIDCAFGTEEHFTAEQLLAWSRVRDQSVSRATIYRTLPLLTESGLVREMDFGKDQKIYDPNYAQRPRHNHIICLDCNKIFEFDSDEFEALADAIAESLGFSAQSRRLQLTARCEELRQLGVCKKRGD